MKFKDMKQAVALLYKEWNLGKKESGATGNICAWIYLMEILSETEQFVIYKEKNKLIGFGGYSNTNSKRHFIRKKIYEFIGKQLYRSKDIKDINGLKQYYDNYDYTPKEMNNYFDGELSILIVDEVYRGKGIGQKILTKVFELARNDGMKNIQILTDDSCNYKFYELQGCDKVYETVVKNEEYGILGKINTGKAFIYEKKLV